MCLRKINNFWKKMIVKVEFCLLHCAFVCKFEWFSCSFDFKCEQTIIQRCTNMHLANFDVTLCLCKLWMCSCLLLFVHLISNSDRQILKFQCSYLIMTIFFNRTRSIYAKTKTREGLCGHGKVVYWNPFKAATDLYSIPPPFVR